MKPALNPEPADRRATLALRLYALVLLAAAAPLLWGGVTLLRLGGSPYYLLAGAATAASAGLLWRARLEGALVYAALLLATLAWALWEAGFDGWALAPRLVAPVVLGLPLLVPWLRRPLVAAGPAARRAASAPALLGALVAAGALGAALAAFARTPDPADPMHQTGAFAGTVAATAAAPAAPGDGEWRHFGRDGGGSRFSPLAQVTPANVSRLKLVWTARVGPTKGLQVTPLMVGRTLYLCTAYNDVIALDAETGRRRWRWRANVRLADVPYTSCRGVAFHRQPGVTGLCAKRVLTNTVDARLVALDAVTGRPCPGFGVGGQVRLLTGLSPHPKGFYAVTSAPTLVRGKVVLGGWISDGQYWGEPSGVIRAFDAVTGRLAWAWDMGRPDRTGLPPPGEFYTPSTPNAWGPMSADERLGLVYVPTGNPAIDYYGRLRRPFDERYGSATVALDADTGRPRWTFQAVHHDLWDWDNAAQPTLADIRTPAGVRAALVQPTKRGEIFVLDRATGRPIHPVAELPVPQRGAVPEERLSPTQPFSVGMPSFRGPDFTERFMWGATPIDQLWCRIKYRQARYEGTATPPGLRPNIHYPGYSGGIDWGGVSVDPERGLLFVNSNRVGNYDRLIPRREVGSTDSRKVGFAVPQTGAPYGASVAVFASPLGIPCNQPPWGMIAAVDLASGKLVWSRRLGSARAGGPLGLRSHLPITIGAPNTGGTLATRGGLLFAAAAQDGDFRAFDMATGRVLWHVRLPAGGQATPMSYVSPESGRQFVAIAAAGHTYLGARFGDHIVAYALPR